jgi:hypothetical protein
MTSNRFVEYYINQAGTGIAGYSGVRYQKGHGFFGRLLSGAVFPILKYLGKKALNTGINIGSDILQGENFKTSMKKRLKTTGFDIAEDALEKVKNYKQKGSGRRQKSSKKKSSKRKRPKRIPSILQLRALAKGRLSLKNKRRKRHSKSRKRRKNKFSLF